MITLYDSKTRKKCLLEPLIPGKVSFYACGPTVYDAIHIGNARPLIVFDTLFRLLRHVYGSSNVAYARNITDVDDKINARASEQKINIRDLTDQTIEGFHRDTLALGCLPPTHEPRATDFIPAMISLIQTLIEKGRAYEAEGHVLFSVRSFGGYGLLSKRSPDEMMAGARVEVAPYKREALDFVLWKPSHEGQPGWESPWGYGRPGWHIECSAMVWKLLGERIDIHCGGIDLIFPHHENERAQSCAAHGHRDMATLWMHNGFLGVEGEKMSKSLGNFVLVRDVIASHGGMAVRLAMLSTLYRQPIDWRLSALDQARKTLKKWRDLLSGSAVGLPDELFVSALADDLNTPRALARLYELAEDARGSSSARETMLGCLSLLGLDRLGDEQSPESRPDEAEILALIASRNQARADKNFKHADEIRDDLLARGIVIKDGKEGTSWEYDQ